MATHVSSKVRDELMKRLKGGTHKGEWANNPPPIPAASPTAIESMVEASFARMLMVPPASTSERVAPSFSISALIVLVITFPAIDNRPDAAPAAATPPTNPKISDCDWALTDRVEPLDTAEPLIRDSMLLVITLTPAITPAATPPAPAALNPMDRIIESSEAEISTDPPALAVAFPSTVA